MKKLKAKFCLHNPWGKRRTSERRFFYRSYRYIALIVEMLDVMMNHFYPVSQKLELYRNNFKNWNFGFAKASGLNDRKSVNISNIDQFMIVQSRELSRCQNPILEVVSVYLVYRLIVLSFFLKISA